MADIKFAGSGPRLSSKDIARADKKMNVRFPTEYRHFLLMHNGGVPDKTFLQWRRRGEVLWGWIDEFMPLGDVDEAFEPTKSRNSVWWDWNRYRPWLPDGSIPIAAGPDHTFVIHTKGPHRGQIWMRDWSDYGDDMPDTALYFIAKDLSTLMGQLIEDAPPGAFSSSDDTA